MNFSRQFFTHVHIVKIEGLSSATPVTAMFFFEALKVMTIHLGRLTWNLKMMVWKMIFLFNRVILRFHVNVPGSHMICTQYRVYFKPTRNFMESHPGKTQSLRTLRRKPIFQQHL